MIKDLQQPIVFIAPEGREEEVVTRLSRVGYDNTLGYLDGGMKAWAAAGKEVGEVKSITADQLAEAIENGAHVLDVRKEGEYLSEHVKGADNLALDYINENMDKIDDNTTYHLHCAGGYRSVIFASILKARGFHNLINVEGGWNAIKEVEAIAKTDYVCPSTLK
jgi:rhodanese-related sulfurtransferase